MVMLLVIVAEYIDKPGAGRNQAEDSGEWKNTVAVDKSCQIISTTITTYISLTNTYYYNRQIMKF
jgi:hypothetical protein